MKKKIFKVQFLFLFLMVSLNLMPSKVYAQEQMTFMDYKEEVFSEEEVRGSIEGKERHVYLLSSIGETLKFSLHAEKEGTKKQDIQAKWQIVKGEECDSDSEALYTADEVIAEENIVFSQNTYNIEKKIDFLEADYFIVVEGLTEETSFDYSFSLEPVITYAASINIPKSLILEPGDREELKVTKVKPSGAELGITWSSTNQAVATVDKETGEVVAKKYGTAHIKAKLKTGKVYQCKVYVEQPKLSKSSVILLKGKKTTLSVSKNYSKVKYSSSNKKVAVVTSKGVITGKGKGTAKITAQVGTQKLVCKVKVEVPKINKSKVSLTAGKTTQLSVNGTERKVKWSSSNTSVATVNSQGKVTSRGAGKAKITGSIDGKTVVSCYIIVKAVQKKAPASNGGGGVVYITRTGEKYHRYGCRYLRQSCIPISLNTAISTGYDACSICY